MDVLSTKLEELNRIFSAGLLAVDDESFTEIKADLDNIIKASLKPDGNKTAFKWAELIEKSFTTGMHEIAAKLIEPESYFALGRFILSADDDYRSVIRVYLELFKQSAFLNKIYGDRKWDKLISDLILKGNYTLADILNMRVKYFPLKPVFRVIHGQTETVVNWSDLESRAADFRNSLFKLRDDAGKEIKIAFLMENSLTMALLDIACLTAGVVDVMIPAASVSEHIEFILNKVEADYIFISNEKQLSKLNKIKDKLPFLRGAVISEGSSVEDWVMNFRSFVQLGEDYHSSGENKIIQPKDTATIMFTSGTTGEPKGIIFSHQNIIYKRFCRAMALPDIGEKDRFLCYLPLFHTFGRYLEMTGSLFWNAEYVFMENPSLETMIANMKFAKPTTFISIPKKWLQLYEYICSLIDIELEDESKIQNVVNEVTGGNLKRGLSAAGFLPPEVFRFYQKYGIELMSGFGMTEGTGGITMTPPGSYSDNSLGKALPGIEIKLAGDGELLIRGDYVMEGYYGQSYEETFLDGGWLPTGDIMKMDDNGFIEIIDRKKEIYKNIKGETVAPQKIENLFKDFDAVRQVFIVGDHKQYNTALIYPDFQNEIMKNMPEREYYNFFSSIIVTVNKFLAPFERILNFKIIDRPFGAEFGELTPKGTFKRRIVEKNFVKIIEDMYRKDHIRITDGRLGILIPNWFLREKGCLSGDIKYTRNKIIIDKISAKLTLEKVDNQLYRIGSFIYSLASDKIDLSPLLTNPVYWLGNAELIKFAGSSIYQWYRKSKIIKDVAFYSRAEQVQLTEEMSRRFELIFKAGEFSLQGLNLAVIHLQCSDEYKISLGVKYFAELLKDSNLFAYEVASELLKRPELAVDKAYRRSLLSLAIDKYSGTDLKNILKLYANFNSDILDDELINHLARHHKGRENLKIFIELIDEFLPESDEDYFEVESIISALFKTLIQLGIRHPTIYKTIRQIIVGYLLKDINPKFNSMIKSSLRYLQKGFGDWIGRNQSVTVDPETGSEYKWKDVIIFEEDIINEDKVRIGSAIAETSILRQSIFLFSKGSLIRLNDILPGGIWISALDSDMRQSSYRVSVQTRHQGSFDLVMKLNHYYSKEEIENEIYWLIAAGAGNDEEKLLEDFGGYSTKYDLWCEEFSGGETVDKYIRRQIRRKNEPSLDKLRHQWSFFVWNAASAYYSFYKLTGYRMEIAEPSAANVIVPMHDYQTGTRLVSISHRIESDSILSFFERFYRSFVLPIVDEVPRIDKKSIWNYIFSGIYESAGEENGLSTLTNLLEALPKSKLLNRELKEFVSEKLKYFIKSVEERDFIRRELFFAIKRFHRWYSINKDASESARAQMLQELYETYNLIKLEKIYPETRVKFFLETVFGNSNPKLCNKLNEIVLKLHLDKFNMEMAFKEYSFITENFDLTESDSYFLARLYYPHLKPTDEAEFVKSRLDIVDAANLVVQMEDYDGVQYLIRKPVSPREIAKLHKLFIDANLQVNFKPENHFLVAVSDRGFIIGGLFYLQEDEAAVHMEKIVVSNRYRRKGISEGLMTEFFSRMKDENYRFITTGFFRPEYFYKFGFSVEPRYAGLVKQL